MALMSKLWPEEILSG